MRDNKWDEAKTAEELLKELVETRNAMKFWQDRYMNQDFDAKASATLGPFILLFIAGVVIGYLTGANIL